MSRRRGKRVRRASRAFRIVPNGQGVTLLLIAVALLAPVVDAAAFDPLALTGAGSDLPNLCLTPSALGAQPRFGPGPEAGFVRLPERLLWRLLLPSQPFTPPRS